MSSALAADRRYCRIVLPRVSRTFALGIRLLQGSLGEAVRTGYLLCRTADALEDSWPGTPHAIAGRFDTLHSARSGDRAAAESLAAAAAPLAPTQPDLALVAALPRVLRVHAALADGDRAAVDRCLDVMIPGMRHYATRAAARPASACYLDTEEELHHYCYVVAGCVGEMLTALVERRMRHDPPGRATRRRALAPTVGEALQLTNVLLDWPTDVRRGRCHVPAEWLAAHDLTPRDLVTPHPALREMAERLADLARAALAQVPDYVATLPAAAWRYRLFCLWPARWARASLEVAMAEPSFPWGAKRPKLSRAALRREALAAVFDPAGRALRGTDTVRS